MRTTIEITDQQRAKPIKLAGERGEKGFSRLVQEAIDEYLRAHHERRDLVAAAKAVLGTADDDFGSNLEDALRKSRSSWR